MSDTRRPVDPHQPVCDPGHHPERTTKAPAHPDPVGTLGRFEFYDAARSPGLALAIVTADIRTSANLLLTIGVRAEGTLSTR
ncbi:hypothetical protein OG241_04995 [Streptomyces sp. NBC_01390]|uniref:hypothetical protein n=1 Tax=Streptomyces sp. NBC_01390 TaxID=2903850 RepID=UPI00325602A8